MISKEEAIEIAKKAIEGTIDPQELDRINVELKDNEYIVEFVLVLEPDTLGAGFVKVTVDANSGNVLRKLRDAD